ncbi:MAG: PaaX domain-containing protein, C- domain protein [Actinomycetota bacterium]
MPTTLHFVIDMRTNRDISEHVEHLVKVADAELSELDARPLSTRSVLLSYLLGTSATEVPAAHLVAFGELLDIKPGTVRTTLTRLVDTGDVTATGGRYRLAERHVVRRAQQQLGRTAPSEWDGTWWTAIVDADHRTTTERRHFRAAMTAERWGELRPDIWMRPANLDVDEDRRDVLLTRGPIVTVDPVELATRLWDLDRIEGAARRLADLLGPVAAALDSPHPPDRAAVLPVSFELSATALRHLRADPLLPMQLVEMPGVEHLRIAYASIEARFRTALGPHLRASTARP